MSILGLDIGTTGVKASAFRDYGDFVTSAYREYDLISPQPGHLELDANEVLDAIREVIGKVSKEMSGDPVRSIGACTLGEAAVPVDEHHRPVGTAIVGFEARGEEEMAELQKKISPEEIFEITGHGFNSSHTLFKMMWRKRHTPDVFERANKFLCFADFTTAALGIPPKTDYSIAARTMAFDIHKLDWSETILEKAGISRDLFAPPVAPGDLVGEVGQNELGLPTSCVVGGGLHDQPAGILGSGVRPGESMLAIGTVICLGVRLKSTPTTETMVNNNLCYYPTFGDGQKISIAYNFTGGSLLKWYRDHLAGPEIQEATAKGVDPYERICADLPYGPTGMLVLPHFSMTGTPWLDPKALGAMFGLRLTTERKEFVKGVLEGILYEIKLNAELLGRAGVEIDLYKAIGGASRSATWMQIAADILGKPIAVLSVKEVASLGAALMGARAAGIIQSEEDAYEIIERAATVQDIIEPRPEMVERYAERFAIYRDLYPKTKEISHALAEITAKEEGS